MKVIVGLGNPGRQYHGTRHNVGFAVVDVLAKSPQATAYQTKFQSEIAELHEQAEKLLLVKPQTFMNLSGRAVQQIVDFYQLPVEDLLVVCDDINLPLGKLRVRAKGTHGGHNGLRDIQQHLATTEYSRLRIGVDSPQHDDAIDHVLGKFRPAEREVIEDAVRLSAQAVIVWATRGINACMNEFNAGSAKSEDK